MKIDIEKMNDIKKKPSWRKFTLAAFVTAFFITVSLVFIYFTQEQQSDPASEKIIREAAAAQLNKDPNELTDEDFAKIKSIQISYEELQDITLLRKFKNLEILSLNRIRFPRKKIPKWMSILAKYGILDIKDRFNINLSPLKNLTNLQTLDLSNTIKIPFQIANINPNSVDLEIFRGAENDVNIVMSLKVTVDQNGGAPFKDIKPLSGLVNLKVLDLSWTRISDVKPIKNLTNLQELYIKGCDNITDEKVEDLQKALPNLKIER